MEEALNGATGFFLFHVGADIAGGLGTLGLLLAVIGVYGVVSYAAGLRTHELGIRMALGARRSDVLRMVFKHGVRLVAVGLGVGLLFALAASRGLATLLVGVSPFDPLAYSGALLLLGSVALLASYIPARRATRVDPMVALRYE
jgi:ABC-type antimicrobial peptide transport system permease subunit